MSKTILLLEDDALIALDLEDRVRGFGYDVIGPAGTLEEAAALIEGHLPDAALLDGNINGKSSIDFAALLMERGVPVAFCTGYEKIAGLPEALRNAPILCKPISDDALLKVLRAIASS